VGDMLLRLRGHEIRQAEMGRVSDMVDPVGLPPEPSPDMVRDRAGIPPMQEGRGVRPGWDWT